MKIGVCDDSSHDTAQISAAFDSIKELFSPTVYYYGSGEELISAAKENADFDLVIADIYMNGINGIDTARRLRELSPDTHIAFLTSSSEFAVDAFDIGALHYIIKPVTAEKLKELLERFFGRVRSNPEKIELKSKTKTYSFPVFQVQKLLSSNKGVDVCLKNGETVHIYESFAAVEQQLDTSVFIKISRGFAVNMSFILCMTGDICRLKDGTEILISRRDKAVIRRRYNDFLFEYQGRAYDGN